MSQKKEYIKKSNFLITGGTGSFGTSMVEHLIKKKAKKIVIFSRDEKKQDEMRNIYSQSNLQFVIGDVRNKNSLDNALEGIDYVFHAAALKQVPSCEFYPMEAVETNIIGTSNVVDSAIGKGVKSLVLLSTDKSVYPINAMGMTKGLAEKILMSKSSSISSSKTVLCATRYGNVMGSRGSVIPLFINQIKNGQSLTITDPNMTRFLMSLDESIELVLYAFENGNQGDIFIRKSPATTIQKLATALVDIFNSNSKIRIIGTRHGEKLYETLVSREEIVRSEETKLYYKIKSDSRDLNYNQYFTDGVKEIAKSKDYTSHNTKQLSLKEIKNMLLKNKFVRDHLE